MQPQNSEPIAPISPNPNYDFIYQDPAKPPKSQLFKLPKLPRPLLILAIAVIVLLLVIIFASLTGGGNSNGPALTSVMARSKEIVRVSDLVKAQTNNTDTQSIISTAEAALSSEQASISDYLNKQGVKVNSKDLLVYLNKNTDSQMQTAVQNNNLDSTYENYLRTQLTSYLSQLDAVYKNLGKNGRQIAGEAIISTRTLLAAPQLQTGTSN